MIEAGSYGLLAQQQLTVRLEALAMQGAAIMSSLWSEPCTHPGSLVTAAASVSSCISTRGLTGNHHISCVMPFTLCQSAVEPTQASKALQALPSLT